MRKYNPYLKECQMTGVGNPRHRAKHYRTLPGQRLYLAYLKKKNNDLLLKMREVNENDLDEDGD
jgi:hypothetical protein